MLSQECTPGAYTVLCTPIYIMELTSFRTLAISSIFASVLIGITPSENIFSQLFCKEIFHEQADVIGILQTCAFYITRDVLARSPARCTRLRCWGESVTVRGCSPEHFSPAHLFHLCKQPIRRCCSCVASFVRSFARFCTRRFALALFSRCSLSRPLFSCLAIRLSSPRVSALLFQSSTPLFTET